MLSAPRPIGDQGAAHSLRPRRSADQVFADWVAVQITADALTQYQPKFKTPTDQMNSVINSVRDLCHQESWLEDDNRFHPPPRTRIEAIFGRNPNIREFLGCRQPEKSGYCTFEGGHGNAP